MTASRRASRPSRRRGALERVAVGLLTGPAGRFAAFLAELALALARWASGRLRDARHR